MKTSLKSGNVFVRLLLAHGEKIGIVVFLGCTGMLIYSSLGRDRLGPDEQPDRLVSQARTAQDKIQQCTWDDVPDPNKPQAEKVSLQAMKPVDPTNYPKFQYSMDRPVVKTETPRTDPVLLPAEDLEVTSDAGLWAEGDLATRDAKLFDMITEQRRAEAEREREAEQGRGDEDRPGGRGGLDFGGRRPPGGRGGFDGGRDDARADRARSDEAIVLNARGGVALSGTEDVVEASWVTVLARVPIRAQYQLYRDAFQGARDYNQQRDFPIYDGYVVQRAEVTPAGQGEWKQIEVVGEKSLIRKLKRWPTTSEEVANSQYVHPILTHPLPPLLLRPWDDKVTHSTIPLIGEELPQDMLEEETPEEEPGAEQPTEDDPFARAGRTGGRDGMRGRMEGEYFPDGRGGRETGMGMRGDYGGEGMGGFRGREMGGADYARLSGARGREMIGQVSLGTYAYTGRVPDILLRYIDRNVTPGHKYRYRFQLVLRDPNNNVRDIYLSKPVLERRKAENEPSYRRTEWSEPSPVVGVPLPGRVYVAGAEVAKENNYNDEPSAKLMIRGLDTQNTAEIATDDEFLRGCVLNVHCKAKIIWAYDYESEEEEEFDFRTGMTLLDLTGGQKLGSSGSDLTAPARALLMDPAGRLSVHTEMEDSEVISEYDELLDPSTDSRGMRGRPGMRGREGGPMGFEGEGRF